MPIYRFHCHECGDLFEDFRNIKDKNEKGWCLNCGSEKIERVAVQALGCDCDCGCGCDSEFLDIVEEKS